MCARELLIGCKIIWQDAVFASDECIFRRSILLKRKVYVELRFYRTKNESRRVRNWSFKPGGKIGLLRKITGFFLFLLFYVRRVRPCSICVHPPNNYLSLSSVSTTPGKKIDHHSMLDDRKGREISNTTIMRGPKCSNVSKTPKTK